jgi:hypothetical protein
MLVKNPTRVEFCEIFRQYSRKQGLDYSISLLEELLRERYERHHKPFRRCHPRDILLHVTDLIEFLRLPHVLTGELITRAFDSCFAVSEEEAE